MFSVKNVKNLNKPASVVVVTVGRPVDVAVVIPPFDRAVTFRLCVVVAPTVKVHETREIHVIQAALRINLWSRLHSLTAYSKTPSNSLRMAHLILIQML